MTTLIRPKLPTQFEYYETFFHELQVSVSEVLEERTPPSGSPLPLLDATPGSGSLVGKRRKEGRIFKRYWPTDNRKKPITKDWELSYVVQQLQKITEFGDIRAPKVIDHGTFEITNERPEDAFVVMQGDWVFWHEWRYQRLYQRGDYLSLPPVVNALADIQRYIEEN